MGRVLTIRLSAVTYNEEDVFRSWPNLCALAWPGKGDLAGGGWRPKAGAFAPPVAAEPVRRGVLELAHDLSEEFTFGDWDAELKDRAGNGMADLKKAVADLEKALADWQPQAANAASNDMEDALDKLQRQLA
ncbi:formin-like protein 18 [Desulfovibrio sp. OttesenSCG-928-O18]|nr:formin-like protein 18 [Desulfovibrio sp. OttesenSCG-928-O18]